MNRPTSMSPSRPHSLPPGGSRPVVVFLLILMVTLWACARSDATPAIDTSAAPVDTPAPSVDTPAPSVDTPAPSADPLAPLLYDQEVLAYWQTRYPKSTTRIFEEAFLPSLTPEERRVLVDTPLTFPLLAEEPFRDNPLAYYAGGDIAAVFMPILSLKFLDDLSTAYAWLQLNGYSLETVTDYMAMLKYNAAENFPGGRYPDPLPALHIPENALQDPEVDDLALRFFNSARAFILAHELGHIFHGHSGYRGLTAQQAQSNEADADLFALEMMRRTATIPMGAYLYFLVLTHWDPNIGDFQNDQEWQEHLSKVTHPLTADRMRVLSQNLRDSADSFARNDPNYAASFDTIIFIADGMLDIAKDLEDPLVQQSIALKGLATDPAFLAPRLPGELPCEASSPNVDLEPNPSLLFHGLYTGHYIHTIQGIADEEAPMCIILQRLGDRAKGNFSFGLGEGVLIGLIQGDELHFTWSWGLETGKGVFQALEQGEAFTGTWGYADSRDDAGEWFGSRN